MKGRSRVVGCIVRVCHHALIAPVTRFFVTHLSMSDFFPTGKMGAFLTHPWAEGDRTGLAGRLAQLNGTE